jgi:hypothetical protein
MEVGSYVDRRRAGVLARDRLDAIDLWCPEVTIGDF